MLSFSCCSVLFLTKLITNNYYCQEVQIVIQYSYLYARTLLEEIFSLSLLRWYNCNCLRRTSVDLLRKSIQKRVQIYNVELDKFIEVYQMYSLLNTSVLQHLRNKLYIFVKVEMPAALTSRLFIYTNYSCICLCRICTL